MTSFFKKNKTSSKEFLFQQTAQAMALWHRQFKEYWRKLDGSGGEINRAHRVMSTEGGVGAKNDSTISWADSGASHSLSWGGGYIEDTQIWERRHVFGHAGSEVTWRIPDGETVDRSVEKFRRGDINLAAVRM